MLFILTGYIRSFLLVLLISLSFFFAIYLVFDIGSGKRITVLIGIFFNIKAHNNMVLCGLFILSIMWNTQIMPIISK